ncbi:DUF2721 domain-containing protein [Cyanobium sp. Lug-B]|jgi:hypothetical protein|uniref:DUF2721 domain-containing protein n=1 Tax=Aphanothece cf. minutissima CCALA 015 TaxID=2107695 RepID=A0ABX5F6U3_9CHRO|nr:DUF2721 domain-containing protein [Cyanobium sp. Lug-B]PSB37236.1 DUF2721 domain-containing protein [Aphanothece cf. minutissima CCALA 015]
MPGSLALILLVAPHPAGPLPETIRLAVTPVFLLAGISGLLGVITTRLARIVDRARLLKERTGAATVAQERELQEELMLHRRRMFMASRAFACATTSFLLVATVVVVLFVSTLATMDVTPLVAVLFVLAMGSLMTAVVLLLREVQLGSLALRRF